MFRCKDTSMAPILLPENSWLLLKNKFDKIVNSNSFKMMKLCFSRNLSKSSITFYHTQIQNHIQHLSK